jgi:hypothetical protein
MIIITVISIIVVWFILLFLCGIVIGIIIVISSIAVVSSSSSNCSSGSRGRSITPEQNKRRNIRTFGMTTSTDYIQMLPVAGNYSGIKFSFR